MENRQVIFGERYLVEGFIAIFGRYSTEKKHYILNLILSIEGMDVSKVRTIISYPVLSGGLISPKCVGCVT